MTGQSPAGKLATAAALAPLLRDGMTLGIGGFGLDRKPMALLREVVRAGPRDLAVETYAGGLDIELLLAAGSLAQVHACHVGLDHFGLAPLFRAARQSGAIAFEEWSEWTQLAAWRAAAEGVEWGVVRLDPGTDLLRVNPKLRSVTSPFGGAEAVAVAAPRIDLALLHAEAVHPEGWAIAEGDPYMDEILARAAGTVVVSAERIIGDAELEARHRDVHLLASYVDLVIPAPMGALPGSCLPDYMIDLASVRAYLEAAAGTGEPAALMEALLRDLPPMGAMQ
ncbi:MAG TPA: CoA-transferase [Paracoccaceae bacterium]|nr:CoA-transferase [Paracoccaceae bacterium]